MSDRALVYELELGVRAVPDWTAGVEDLVAFVEG